MFQLDIFINVTYACILTNTYMALTIWPPTPTTSIDIELFRGGEVKPREVQGLGLTGEIFETAQISFWTSQLDSKQIFIGTETQVNIYWNATYNRFMLEQNLAKTMLEFQELMTVFQVLMIEMIYI